MSLSQDELIQVFKKLQQIDKDEFHINTPIFQNMRTYGRWTCKNAKKLSIRINGDVM